MPQSLSRNYVRIFRCIVSLLIVGFSYFPSSDMLGAFGVPGPIQDMENQRISRKFSSEKISIDSDGNIIQAFPNGKTRVVGQALQTMPAKATSLVKMSGTLNATHPASKSFSTAQLLADPFNPGFTQFSVSLHVFDSLGIEHGITAYFSKIANNSWQYFVLAKASEVSVTAGNSDSQTGNALVSQGKFGFTGNGALDVDVEEAAQYFNSTGTGIDFKNGAARAQALVIDVGTSVTTDKGNGNDGFVQQGSQSMLLTLSQDGFGFGTFNGLAVLESGSIVGRYSNGQTVELGQAFPLRDKDHHKKQNQQHRTPKKHGKGPSVTRTLEFPNSMNAVQSGVWTVGQFGSWSVNVDSSSEHPVVVKDVSMMNKKPWAYTQSFQFQHDSFSADEIVLTVPSGKRLFLQHVSLQTTTVGRSEGANDPQVMASMNTTYNKLPLTYQLGLSDIFRIDREGRQEVRHILSKSIRFYADDNSQIRIGIDRNFDGKPQEGTISLTGYLEQVP